MSDVFNGLLEAELGDPEFAREYAAESARIAAIDSIVRMLDETRRVEGLSKTALARAIGADPSVVRRLLSADDVNPTVGRVAELAAALGLKLALVPLEADERVRLMKPLRDSA